MRAGDNDFIMAGHIAAPEITGDSVPASMSEYMIKDILKTKLNFGGLVITDSLAMKAVTDSYSPGEAALAALNAGCDVILMPMEYRETFDAVAEAVKSGEYSEAELNKTVEHILRFKMAHNLI